MSERLGIEALLNGHDASPTFGVPVSGVPAGVGGAAPYTVSDGGHADALGGADASTSGPDGLAFTLTSAPPSATSDVQVNSDPAMPDQYGFSQVLGPAHPLDVGGQPPTSPDQVDPMGPMGDQPLTYVLDPSGQNGQTPDTAYPVTSDPTVENPVTSDPTAVDPVTSEPTTVDPITSDPTVEYPVTSDPTAVDPVTGDPTASPVTGDPTALSPDHTGEQPIPISEVPADPSQAVSPPAVPDLGGAGTPTEGGGGMPSVPSSGSGGAPSGLPGAPVAAPSNNGTGRQNPAKQQNADDEPPYSKKTRKVIHDAIIGLGRQIAGDDPHTPVTKLAALSTNSKDLHLSGWDCGVTGVGIPGAHDHARSASTVFLDAAKDQLGTWQTQLNRSAENWITSHDETVDAAKRMTGGAG